MYIMLYIELNLNHQDEQLEGQTLLKFNMIAKRNKFQKSHWNVFGANKTLQVHIFQCLVFVEDGMSFIVVYCAGLFREQID